MTITIETPFDVGELVGCTKADGGRMEGTIIEIEIHVRITQGNEITQRAHALVHDTNGELERCRIRMDGV